MRKLDSYIARSVFGSVLLVLLVIVSLDAIAALIDQSGEVKGNYDLFEVLVYVGLTLPGRIYANVPFSSLVGCLIGLGLLAGSSELVIMRAAGVSVRRIVWSVMRPVLFFIFAAGLLGEYVTPYTDQFAESRRALAQGDTNALESRHGLWNREGRVFMHFNAVLPRGVLFGVTRYEFDDEGKLLSSSFSKRASYQGSYWLEEESVLTRFEEGKSSSVSYPTRRWETDLDPNLLNVLILQPEALSIQSLYSYSTYLEQQGVESEEYWLTFWQKVLQPVATISLVIIAISFIFGPLREVTMGFRIFSGVIVGIVFRTAQDLLGPSSLVFGFSPLVAVLVPIGICLLVGIVLLQRSR